MLIHIQDDIVRLQHCGLLDRLLKDKTTKNNIMWATDAYAHYGHEYERNEEIRPHLITGENVDIIKTRARKEFEQQNQRTRKRAEVFTPMWICQMMNDKLDEEWFGYPDAFFKGDRPTKEIRFFEKKRTWQDYVDSRRLEITCGEAPYLMSRYDVATGEIVPIEKRCGIFDRKLRVVNENTTTEEEWMRWAIRATQSTYGYEFQGDNLLIARINVLCTFEDFFQQRWNRKLTRKETEKIINIITWNLWQMDGLTNTIPYREAEPDFVQLSLFYDFEEDITKGAQPLCRVYDWRADRSGTFNGIKGGENKMKFDYIIGNPPYQDSTDTYNRQEPIYQYFYDSAETMTDKYCLISPARFLFNAGLTPKTWNQKMLNDDHIKVVYYNQDASQVFPNTMIKGGIAIVYRDATKSFGAIIDFIPDEDKRRLASYFTKDEKNFPSIMYGGRSDLKFNDEFLSDYPHSIEDRLKAIKKKHSGVTKLGPNEEYELKSSTLEVLEYAFTEDTPENPEQYYRILGLVNTKRVYRWIPRKYMTPRYNDNNIDSYKVFIPKAIGTGEYGEKISQPIISRPGESATPTFIGVGNFKTEVEAKNVSKYIKTKFVRALLGLMKITHDNIPSKWAYVPVQDFSNQSDIDWSKSIKDIDLQLYKKYGFGAKDIDFIESNVKEME